MHCRLCIYCTHALDALFFSISSHSNFLLCIADLINIALHHCTWCSFVTILSHIVRNWWQSQSHKMSNVAIIVHLNVNDYFLYFFHTFMSNESFSRIILQVVKLCVVHVYDNCVLKTTKEPLSKSMTGRHTCSINGVKWPKSERERIKCFNLLAPPTNFPPTQCFHRKNI